MREDDHDFILSLRFLMGRAIAPAVDDCQSKQKGTIQSHNSQWGQ